MEFSVSRSIQRLKPMVSTHSYPQLSSTPSQNYVIPGLGHTIKQTNLIVSLPEPKSANHISKSIEPTENVQTGGGGDNDVEQNDYTNSDIDKILVHSMKHPRMIQTGSISIGAGKTPKHKLEAKQPNSIKRQKLQSSQSGAVVHKFQFM